MVSSHKSAALMKLRGCELEIVLPIENIPLNQYALHARSIASCHMKSLACCWYSSAANLAQSFAHD